MSKESGKSAGLTEHQLKILLPNIDPALVHACNDLNKSIHATKDPIANAVLSAGLQVPSLSATSVRSVRLGDSKSFSTFFDSKVNVQTSLGTLSVTFSREKGGNEWSYKLSGSGAGLPYLKPLESLRLSQSARKSLEYILNQKVLEYKRDVLHMYDKPQAQKL